MINEILFVHHSHTDIGYTHPQPVVMELHRRFTDEALDLAERTAAYPDDARFRWTCEVTGITVDWWKHATNADRDRFMAAIKRGQFDVAGMGWHMTPLMDHSMVVDVLKPLTFLRDLGIPVHAAMNTDVNGLPWGVVDALLDHGITGISMAINEHYGHALRPWPRAFNWQAPGGRTITAYNGFIYGVTSDRSLRIPLDMDEARDRVPKWAKRWEDGGYPHPFLMMQITNIRYHDNGAPQAGLPDFIQRFNEGIASTGGVKLRIGTISEFFDRVRAQPAETLPTMRGDWTDWWNFGAGSTAHETSQTMRGQRDLDAALAAEAWHPGEEPRRRAMLHDIARADLALYAEHTWGADRSISHPYSPETRTQQLLKLASAANGASVARMLRRDGLEQLAIDAGGDEPRLLVFNPHPFPVEQSLRLPYLPPMAGAPDPERGFGLETLVPSGPSSHRIQRQDVVMSDLSEDRAYWTTLIAVPALSYVTLPAANVVPAATTGLSAKDGVLSNGRVTVMLDPRSGALTSLKRDGVEYAGAAAVDLHFGVPVLEKVASGIRTDMFDVVQLESPDWNLAWHKDWKAERDVLGVLGDTHAYDAPRQRRDRAVVRPGQWRPGRGHIPSASGRSGALDRGRGHEGAKRRPAWHLPADAGGAERRLGRRFRDGRRGGEARRRATALRQPALHHHAALYPHRRCGARADGRLPRCAALARRRFHLRPLRRSGWPGDARTPDAAGLAHQQLLVDQFPGRPGRPDPLPLLAAAERKAIPRRVGAGGHRPRPAVGRPSLCREGTGAAHGRIAAED